MVDKNGPTEAFRIGSGSCKGPNSSQFGCCVTALWTPWKECWILRRTFWFSMITWGSHKIATTFEGGQASKSEAKIHSYPKSNPLKSIPSCPNIYFPIFSSSIPLISQILVEILLCLSSSSMMSLLRRHQPRRFLGRWGTGCRLRRQGWRLRGWGRRSRVWWKC